MPNYSIDDARDALNALDPGVSHAEWVRIGMAAHAAGLGVEDWIDWSSRSDAYNGDKECRTKWRSFRDGDVTAGTLYYLAREAGWEPRRDGRNHHDALAQNRRPAQAAQSKPAAKRSREPSPEDIERRKARMRELLAAARPASELHPYLVSKQESAEGLLEVDLTDLVRILGYHPEGKGGELQGGSPVLLVPLHDGSGEPSSLEMIDGRGNKAGLALPRSGLMWTPRHFSRDDHIIGVSEGLATAKTIMRLRKHLVVSAGTANNLPKVAQRVSELCPDAEIVIYADLGTDGQNYGQAAADSVMGLMVSPPAEIFDDPNGKDFNDAAWYMSDEDLAQYLNARSVHPQRITFAMARTFVEIDYVLPSLPRGAVGLLVGQGSIGKSYMALELAMSVAIAKNLIGAPGQFEHLKPGSAAMVFGEDPPEIVQNRMHHLAKTFSLSDRDQSMLDRAMYVWSLVGEDMRIAQVEQRTVREGPFLTRLRRICQGRRLVFVDPLIRLHDADENDNTAASALMLAVQRIARDTKCSIVLLHHMGKGGQDGQQAARGASAIPTTARWQLNMAPPSKDEREQFNMDADEARLWVKCDGVKMNYGENVRHFWLRRGPHGILRHDDPALAGASQSSGVDPFDRGNSGGTTRPPPGRR